MMRKVEQDKLTQGRNKGFTLIELLVSIALLALVMTMIYSFFGFSNNFFGVTDRRADAQTQLSAIMAGLKSEVSTAATVKITDNTSTIGGDEKLYYAGSLSTNQYTLLRKSAGINATAAFSNVPLKGFQITFEYDSFNKPKILIVSMTTSEGYTLSGELYSQNVNISGSATGNALVLVPAQ